MRAVSSPLGRKSLVLALPLLAACAAAHPGPALVGPTDNQVTESRSPHITLLAQGSGPSRTVDAGFRVDAEGYALVVAVDRDQRVHVLFPESPSSDGFVTPDAIHPATSFFEGSGRGAFQSGLFDSEYFPYRRGLYPYQAGLSRYGAAVFLVAIVSGEPLQLDRLRDTDGGWADANLRAVVLDPAPSFVGERLGRLVSRPGQQFSTDYRVIMAGGSSPLYASSYYRGCGFGAFGTGYMDPFYAPTAIGLDPFTPRTSWIGSDFGSGDLRFAAQPLTARCGPMELWDPPAANVRRPPELFPRDTSLLFTTRRVAMRPPGGGGLATPGAFPAGVERGNGGPDLSRIGPTASRAGESGAAPPPPPPPRHEPRAENATPSPASAPSRRGPRR